MTVTSLAAAGLIAAAAAPAFAGGTVAAHDRGGRDGVFVQTNNLSGNQIAAYHRAPDGGLTPAATYTTGGLGGALTGAVTDKLASQGSLTYDAEHALLFAVNAGSNSVSVFGVDGDQLSLHQVVDSGGTFPVSVAVHDHLVYVLNAENGGDVSGYRIADGRLHHIDGSTRALGLNPTATPQFVNTPGQVGFTPDGQQLIVTTKANGSDIDVFGVRSDGRLSAHPVVNPEPGAVPFGFTFSSGGLLVITEAGPNALATFAVHHDGTLGALATLANGQAASCWVIGDDGNFYVSNTGTPSISPYRGGANGSLALVGSAVNTDPGTIDPATSSGGQFLYVQTGLNGIVDAFRVKADGTLSSIGSTTVPGAAGFEGIVAF